MKITKSIGRLLLSFILLITMLPIDSMTVYANGDIAGYSIILQPGDGSGSPISIHSRDDGRYYGESSNGSGVGNGQFFTMDGEIWFRCPDCPDSFTPPDGKVFAGWNNGVHSAGSYVKLTGDMTLTASWQNDGSVSIILTPDTITLNYDESGWIPFTVNISELNFGPNADDSSEVRIIFDSGGLSNSSGSIDFEIFSADHNDGGNELQWETKQTGLNEMALRIDPQALATALPGVYTGKLYYDLSWYGIGIGQSTVPHGGFIPMTLVVPEPAVTKYTVFVTNGRVNNGTFKGTYEEGESVTIKALGPEDGLKSGLKFKNWTGTSGLNFTSGSATTSTATFVMPAADVKVKAVYETDPIGMDLYTLTLDGNCDDVAGRSFPNLQSFTLPDFSRPEYVFEGWAKSPTGAIEYMAGQSINLTDNLTLYAVWRKKGSSHTVEVHNGTGSGTYAAGEIVTITANSPEAGKYFKWWMASTILTFIDNSGNRPTASFIMPDTDVLLGPFYEAFVAPAISSTGGTSNENEGDAPASKSTEDNSGSNGNSENSAMQPVPATQSAPVIQAAPALAAPAKPATTTDPGKPFVEGNPERSGWDAIKEDIQAAITNKEANSSAENTVMIDMDGSQKVPGDIISEIKGQDVTAVFDLGDGIKWSINGMDITGIDIKDIDLAVALDTNSIPGEVVTPLVGERYSRQISLAYEGDFGLTATLSVDMDAKNAGLFANLFYFNETKDELEFICANQIANDGTAELAFTHASDYVIVVDKEPMDGSFTEPEAHSENTVTGLGTQERTVESTLEETVSQSDARSPWRVIAICGAAITIGLCAFYVIMKRKQ